jgi:1-deoxy-D-xylulose-5-phosphate reductoisomerase
VDLFLQGRIRFVDIARVVEEALDRHQSVPHPTLEQILAADAWARESVTEIETKRWTYS